MAGYDVIVVGLGGMGSAAAYHLAQRGARVLGLEQFGVAHDQGSSHGKTRVIRQAYHEGPDYVPLLLRAYDLWHALEREAGTTLLTTTGALYMGTPDAPGVAGAELSARTHHIPYEMLTAEEIRSRYPVFHPRPGYVGLFEFQAGILVPERVLSGAGAVGMVGYAAGPHVYVADQFGLGDPLAARVRLEALRIPGGGLRPKRGRPGHDKYLPGEWVAARFAIPAADRYAKRSPTWEVAARRAIACPPIQRLLKAVDGPMSVDRFFTNVGDSFDLTSLRFSPDPVEAERELCG